MICLYDPYFFLLRTYSYKKKLVQEMMLQIVMIQMDLRIVLEL